MTKKRHRIGLNAIALLSSLTGVGQYTRSLANELLKREECDVHFFYAKSWSRQLRQAPLHNIQAWKELVKRIVPEPYATARKYHQAFFSLGAKLRRLDLYHDPNFLAYQFNGPTVITVHDLSWIRYPNTHPADRVKALNRYFPRSLEMADQIITDAEFTRNEIIQTFGVAPDRITAIPLAARPSIHPRQQQHCQSTMNKHGLQWRHYVLCVGTLEPRKNLELTLRAFASLPEPVQRRMPLVIVGMRGWLLSHIESLISPLIALETVKTLGYLDDDELAHLYAGARMLVYPSIYEGFGLPPLEAMASATPVIVSNASTLPEVVGDAGVLIDPQDVDGLAQAIQRLMEDDSLWDDLVARSLARATHFSWARCASETVSVYQRAQQCKQ